jgi:hypothetical protein
MKKLVTALLMVPAMAHAQFMTGNKLLGYLSGDTDIERIHGMGYVIGVHDAFDSTICLTRGVTTQQASDVVRKYLQDNPAQRNMDASVLVLVALGSAFPCANNKGGKKL